MRVNKADCLACRLKALAKGLERLFFFTTLAHVECMLIKESGQVKYNSCLGQVI